MQNIVTFRNVSIWEMNTPYWEPTKIAADTISFHLKLNIGLPPTIAITMNGGGRCMEGLSTGFNVIKVKDEDDEHSLTPSSLFNYLEDISTKRFITENLRVEFWVPNEAQGRSHPTVVLVGFDLRITIPCIQSLIHSLALTASRISHS